MFLFISGQEIFIILLVVLLLFGANKIPEIARGLGKGMREFRKAADDIKREMNTYTDDIKKDMKDVDDNIKGINDDLKG
jgi:sec-independent protein translocase protein TatA